MRFIVFPGGSLRSFEVDGEGFDWGAPEIRGDAIKKLLQIDPDQYGILRETGEGDYTFIGDRDLAELHGDCTTMFVTDPLHPDADPR